MMESAAVVGVLVGVADVLLLYPLVCLASRLESGQTLEHAWRRGALYAGAQSALKLLVPYCILVESVTDAVSAAVSHQLLLPPASPASKLMAAPVSSLVVSLGLQPLEKQVVMEQLLQTTQSGASGILSYAQRRGARGLMKGFGMLWGRETVYIAAVTGLNPLFAGRHGVLAAFAVGFGAGMISAPLQTLNVVMKSEANVSASLMDVVRSERLGVRRLWKGSLPRSLRTGLAGILWYRARSWVMI